MATNQSRATEAAVVFRDVVKVYHPGVRALDSVSFDLYRGEQVGEGKKSFAFRLVLRSPGGTLSEADVERLTRRVTGRLQHALGATIRE